MPAALGADPELIGHPRHSGSGIAHVHLRAAALAADVKLNVAHARDSSAGQAAQAKGDGQTGPESRLTIPAIVLAAGKSTRMGRPKATLPLAGGTFLSRIVRTFHDAGIADVVVVVGHQAHEITAAWPQAGVAARFVLNPDYESGQFSSLMKGLDAVDAPGVAGTLVTLVDVPLVTPDTVRAVLDRYLETHAPVVRPTRGSEHGHPVLIDRSLFEALRGADPRVGAKAIVRAHASREGDLEVADAGAFVDVDTMEEYQRLIADEAANP